jgi:hypothetical protein
MNRFNGLYTVLLLVFVTIVKIQFFKYDSQQTETF